jgi:photosystem II stability/assembly factor-like uncharacterized protein
MIKFKLLLTIPFIFGSLTLIQSQDGKHGFTIDTETGMWQPDKDCKGSADDYGSIMFTWIPVQTPITTISTEVVFTDSLHGFASHLNMGALRTTNSGLNWETYSFNDTLFNTGFNSMYFINNSTGWAVGGALQIRKTTNGGTNWVRQIPPNVAGILRSICFSDENTGYAAGSKGFPYMPFICKTTNGGLTWLEISPSISTARELNDQYWFSSTTGWICGYDVLLYTSNGGTSFTNLYANIPPSGNGHISLLAIDFINSQTGWIGAANLERNNIYKTTNGGTNWFFQSNPISAAGLNQINDVKFISNGIGWAVHGALGTGAIMYTSNGGMNWQMEIQGSLWYDCLEIYQNTKAWCGADGGFIYYTIPENPLGIASGEEIPSRFYLGQNYPNPFNPETNIKFQLAAAGFLRLSVFDILGREVSVLLNKDMNAGSYEVKWNSEGYSSGIYYYKLTSGEYSETRKMILIK